METSTLPTPTSVMNLDTKINAPSLISPVENVEKKGIIKTLMIVAILILIGIIIYFIFSKFNNKVAVAVQGDKGKALLKLYFSPKCPHCVELKQKHWDKIKQFSNGKIDIEEINCDEEKCENIVGVPTLIFINSSNKPTTIEERTADEIIGKLKSLL